MTNKFIITRIIIAWFIIGAIAYILKIVLYNINPIHIDSSIFIPENFIQSTLFGIFGALGASWTAFYAALVIGIIYIIYGYPK